MSKETKRKLAGGAGLVAVAGMLVAVWIATPLWSNEGNPEIREIVLEAKDVAFDGNNPTLRLTPGERVRFVVRNNDPGVLHSITLPGVDSTVRHIRWGEEVAFEDGRPTYFVDAVF